MIQFGSGSQHSINPILNHCVRPYRQSGAPVTLFPLSQCLKKGPHPGRKKDFFGLSIHGCSLHYVSICVSILAHSPVCQSVIQPPPSCHPSPSVSPPHDSKFHPSRTDCNIPLHTSPAAVQKSTCMKKSF